MEYDIRFCTTSDNAQIAYTIIGEGPPLVIPPGWISLLDLDSEDSWSLPFWKELSKYFSVILYDKHGCGLSDRERTDFSFEKEISDLESVIESVKFRRFALFGYSQGGPIAIGYTAKNPNRVSHLIIYGSYRSGALTAPPELKSAICNLIKAHWGLGSKMLNDFFVPDADNEIIEYANKFQQKAASAQMAVSILKAEDTYDVTGMLPEVKVPTLVMHRRNDRAVSSKLGRELAALISGSKFVMLEGNIHLLWLGDTGRIIREIIKFMGLEEHARHENRAQDSIRTDIKLERKLAVIMSADVQGYSRLMQEDEITTINTLNESRDLFTNTVNKYHGKIVDAVGDNILSEFKSVLDAVKCAVTIQKEFDTKNREIPKSRRMLFRIGINLGDIIKDGERIYGDGVNVAARIEALADGCGICVSKSVHDQVENKIDLKFEYLGEQSVKNIKDPVPIYKIII